MTAAFAIGENAVVVFDTVFVVIILKSRLNSYICKHRTEELMCGKPVKRLYDSFVRQSERFGHGLALNKLGLH